ncbi:MAG TPA: family 10 glycosylhydrolase, partial [Puia sp.]|nr:family 10 glycosylhydrolase [Puia sp.]
STTIKKEKKLCKFGISPFGVWRNKSRDPDGSDTRAGQTNYDDLYADILLWLKNGWIDYVAPQIYWEFELRVAPYAVLLDWWSRYSYNRHCYIGLGIYKAGYNPAWRDRTQIPRQIAALRQTPHVQGMIFFSSTSFQRNPNGWNDSLQNNYYRLPALIPPMNWLDSIKPANPLIKIDYRSDSVIIHLSKGLATEDLRGYAIYKTNDPNFMKDSIPPSAFIPYQNDTLVVFKKSAETEKEGIHYYVTAISKTNNESDPVLLPVAISDRPPE